MKIDMSEFFETLSRKLKFRLSLTRITGTLLEDLYTSVIISRSVPFRMINISDKFVEKNSYLITNYVFKKNRAAYEIMWENSVQPDWQQMTIQHMRSGFLNGKATNIHSEFDVILTVHRR